jgi:histidinol-phosphate aminotransferase
VGGTPEAFIAQIKREIIEVCRANAIVVYESDTNFLLLQDQYAGRLANAFAQAKIRVSDCSQYPHSFGLLHNMLRVAVPASADLEKFLKAILLGSGSAAASVACLRSVEVILK